jgi:RNA polymerase sigma factor (sigma-70 family)
MTHGPIRDYLRAAGDSGGAADADLLARFAAGRDEAAFAQLLWRHAALVREVCRAVLRDHHAAEDAAQATFLALARKAHTFAGRGSVVGWLYRVARRASVRLARQRARTRAPAADLDRLPAPPPEPGLSADEAEAVCAETDRLPERYRVPVLLCFFEGLTQTEAARRTGWPAGTVAGRLARAKELLARRLARRGVGLPAVCLGVPAAGFVGATARAAAAFAAGRAVVPGVEPGVLRLAEGATTMTVSAWKLAAAAAAVCAVAAGVWGLAPQAAPPATPTPWGKPAAAPQPAPKTGDALAKKDDVVRIKAGDHLFLDLADPIPGEPLKGVGRVEPSGSLSLGPTYGRVKVAGLTPEEAEAHFRDHLTKVVGLQKPRVSITWYDPEVHGPGTLADRITLLEREVARLREAVEKLRKP